MDMDGTAKTVGLEAEMLQIHLAAHGNENQEEESPMEFIVGVRFCQGTRCVVAEFADLWRSGWFSAQFP